MRAHTSHRSGRRQEHGLDGAQAFVEEFRDGFGGASSSIGLIAAAYTPRSNGEGVGPVDGPLAVVVLRARPSGDDSVVRALAGKASFLTERVTSVEELKRALSSRSWDAIVDDRSGLLTLETLHSTASDAPLIVVGETAVDALGLRVMSQGAADYVGAGDLVRLVAVVEREARAVRARRALLQRLYEDDRFFALGLDLFCIAGFDGRFKRLNAMWSATLGWSESELMAVPWIDFVHPADVAATIEAARRLSVERRDLIGFVNRYRCKDGGYRTFLWTATVDRTQDHFYSVARDITRQKELEEQLLQAQKMEPVGRLAGGIAHDFNNLLTVILSATSSILPGLGEEHAMRNELVEVHDAAMRGAELTKQLLASSGRRRPLEVRVVPLNTLVGEMESLLTRTLGEDVGLTIACDPLTGSVCVDVTQIERALMNLAVNARDAMPEGGQLTIETMNLDVTPDNAARHVGISVGPYVMLVVTDSGEGMSAEVREQVFEPFFTTKEVGHGTGLGLSTVHGVVTRSGGKIRVDSVVGEGTKFTIYLPRTDRPVVRESAPPPLLEVPGGNETILLVEDDRAVRSRMRANLRKSGYNVIEAENAGEALLISEESVKVDLLLTDVVMPRLSGRLLARRMRSQQPDLKVLYMSGYDEDQHRELSTALADAVCICKPFTTETLMQRVRTTLDSES